MANATPKTFTDNERIPQGIFLKTQPENYLNKAKWFTNLCYFVGVI
jgi:hypothetical protein